MSLLCQASGDLSKIVLILAERCLIKSRLIKYPFFFSILLLLSPPEPIKISSHSCTLRWFPKREGKTGPCDVMVHRRTAELSGMGDFHTVED